MKNAKQQLLRGSSNVFRDLGHRNADGPLALSARRNDSATRKTSLTLRCPSCPIPVPGTVLYSTIEIELTPWYSPACTGLFASLSQPSTFGQKHPSLPI
jgi:hypothetical protein